ncbi:MAG: COX15/CtaA family protein [Candidatus Sumerlaeia bacterium]|nr:COX15/CtaA family protein [Candidatus Sumerlaeia bacterium]
MASPEQIREAQTLGAWLVLSLILLFFVVVVGGTVRLTNSGMSIPEWPVIYYGEGKTNPSLLPPLFNEEQWQVAYNTYHRDYIKPKTEADYISMSQFKQEFAIEYGHRFVVSLFGIVFLAVLTKLYRSTYLRSLVGRLVGYAALVLAIQIVLGGKVVINHTHPLYVSVHLMTAFTFISMILWATLRCFRGVRDVEPNQKVSRSFWFAVTTVAVCAFQIFFGGLMAKTGAGKSYNQWPELGERIIPPSAALWNETLDPLLANFYQNLILIQFIHRWVAFVVLFAVIVLALRLMTKPLTSGGRWALRGTVFIVVFQILLGIATLLEAVPFALGLLHLATGLILFELLIFLTFETRTNARIALFEEQLARRTSWEDDPEISLETQTARVSDAH